MVARRRRLVVGDSTRIVFIGLYRHCRKRTTDEFLDPRDCVGRNLDGNVDLGSSHSFHIGWLVDFSVDKPDSIDRRCPVLHLNDRFEFRVL